MSNIVKAPFNDIQVKNINEWQQSGFVHNLSCTNGCDQHGLKIFAIEPGLFCPHCDQVVQEWVPEVVADGTGLLAAEEKRALLNSFYK